MCETADDVLADEQPPALGIVLDQERGSLPYALIHGEALVACAAWALGEARVTLVDARVDWPTLRDAAEPLLLHDALCPMTPASFIAQCLASAVRTGAVVAGAGGSGAVLSPVVLPAQVVGELDGLPSVDLPELVRQLEARFSVQRVPAPASASRVASLEDIAALEALTGPETP